LRYVIINRAYSVPTYHTYLPSFQFYILHLLTHTFTHLPTHPPVHLLIHSSIHAPIHPSVLQLKAGVELCFWKCLMSKGVDFLDVHRRTKRDQQIEG